MAEEKDISGLEFSVTKNGAEGGIQVQEDEWLPAVLTNFAPFENQWGKQLRWTFELQGESFVWKSKDGKTGQFRVSGNSSYVCSPKSKLYKWYSKITGKEPVEGESIKLKTILNAPCYVMIKINKGKDKDGEPKDYYNVDKVKLREKIAEQVAPTQAATPAPVQAATPAPTAAPVKSEVPKTTPAGSSNIFEDIY